MKPDAEQPVDEVSVDGTPPTEDPLDSPDGSPRADGETEERATATDDRGAPEPANADVDDVHHAEGADDPELIAVGAETTDSQEGLSVSDLRDMVDRQQDQLLGVAARFDCQLDKLRQAFGEQQDEMDTLRQVTRGELLVSLGRDQVRLVEKLADQLANYRHEPPPVSPWADHWRTLATVSTMVLLFLLAIVAHPQGRIEMAKVLMDDRQEVAFDVALRVIEIDAEDKRKARAEDATP